MVFAHLFLCASAGRALSSALIFLCDSIATDPNGRPRFRLVVSDHFVGIHDAIIGSITAWEAEPSNHPEKLLEVNVGRMTAGGSPNEKAN